VWAVVLSGVHNDSRYKKRIIGIQCNYIIEEDVHHTLHTGSCISGTPLVQIFQMYSHRNPSVDLETCSYDYEYDYHAVNELSVAHNDSSYKKRIIGVQVTRRGYAFCNRPLFS